jgi:hypothetical protein
MRKISILLIAVLPALMSVAQDTTTGKPSIEIDYLKKSRQQKTAAWVLTGAGTVGLLTTLLADATQTIGGAFVTVVTVGSVEPEHKSYAVPYLLSSAAIIGGITLFTASSRSKQKIKNLSGFVEMESVQVVAKQGIQQQSLPVIGVRVRL